MSYPPDVVRLAREALDIQIELVDLLHKEAQARTVLNSATANRGHAEYKLRKTELALAQAIQASIEPK